MNIINKKLLNKGDECYCIHSSYKNPHIYLRFKCKVIERVDSAKLQSFYYLKIVEILEADDDIKLYMTNILWRVVNLENGRFPHVYLYSHNVKNPKINLFSERYEKLGFELGTEFVFESESEMQKYYNKSNEYIIDIFKENINELENRIKKERH